MKPLEAPRLTGTWCSVMLPVDEHDEIDFSRLERYVRALIGSGVDGIYTNGTAGEFYAQSEQEFDRISVMVAAQCEPAGMPFQLGASHPCPRTVLDRARRAAALKPGAIQVIMPEWVVPSEADLVDFLSRIADEIAPVPLVLYNPPHAKRVLDVALLARLHERVPALIGVKVTDGNASWYATAARELGDVAVFVPGHHLATGMLHGAAGSYSNVACLNPRGAMRWQELIGTDISAALGLQQRILDFMQVHIQPLAARGYSGIDKLLVAVGGWADLGTKMRWPYHGVPAEHATGLAGIAREELPELFDAALPA